jgi:hypothetical protein
LVGLGQQAARLADRLRARRIEKIETASCFVSLAADMTSIAARRRQATMLAGSGPLQAIS